MVVGRRTRENRKGQEATDMRASCVNLMAEAVRVRLFCRLIVLASCGVLFSLRFLLHAKRGVQETGDEAQKSRRARAKRKARGEGRLQKSKSQEKGKKRGRLEEQESRERQEERKGFQETGKRGGRLQKSKESRERQERKAAEEQRVKREGKKRGRLQ